MIWRRIACAAVLVAGSLLANIACAEIEAQPRTQASGQGVSAPARPRICLALSGGGARGYAHLGVLKELEALHVPIDCIAGTSMGAVIGSLYASGMTADAIEQALSELDLSNIAFDRESRADVPETSRQDGLMYPIGVPMGFGDGRLKVSSGLVQGNKLMALLRSYTGQFPGDVDFDRLPIPFRAVATDLETGGRVVLSHGSLPLAVRASMAVPGLFTPVKIDGHTLIDGGSSSNLPIDVARGMGADIVIAVDIGTPLKRADQINSMADVTSQMIRFMMQRDVDAQRATLRPTDILINPELGTLSFSDFGAMKQGVAAGSEATLQISARLAALSSGKAEYAAWRAGLSHDAALPPDTRVDRIEVKTKGRVPPRQIEQALHLKPGDVYDPAGLDRDLTQLAHADNLETVSQTLTGLPGDRVLHVEASAKSWGPNILLFGLGMSTNFDGAGAFTLQIGHRLPWITESGLSWRNDIVLGNQDLGWHTELRQPIFGQVYLAPYASIRRTQENYYLPGFVNGPPLSTYMQQVVSVGIDIGVPLGNWGDARVGIAEKRDTFQVQSSFVSIDKTDTLAAVERQSIPPMSQTVAQAGLTIDQLDDPIFPRRGFRLETHAEADLRNGEYSYDMVYGRGLWAASHGIFSVNAAFEAGGQLGSKLGSPVNYFNLGGFQHLSAYAQDQLNGPYILYGRVTGLAELSKSGSGPLRATFAGVSLEGGNVWDSSKQFARGPWLSSIGAFVGATTVIGPAYLGFAMGPGGVNSVYFQLGNRF